MSAVFLEGRGAVMFYRYSSVTKKCQQEKKNENNYESHFPTDKSRELQGGQIFGMGFCK